MESVFGTEFWTLFWSFLFTGGIWKGIEELQKYKKRKTKDEFFNGMKAVVAMSYGMRILRHMNTVHNVRFFEISNEGHTPKVGSRIFAKSIDIEDQDPIRGLELKERYKKVQLDSNYVNMIIEAEKHGSYDFDVDKEPDGILKHFYKSEKIVYSEVYYLGIRPEQKKMFIVSVTTKLSKKEFKESNEYDDILAQVELMRNIF